MARYDFHCPNCASTYEVVMMMREYGVYDVTCDECGATMDRVYDFSGVRTEGFLGRYTLNPNIDRFLATGEPSGLRRGEPGYVP